MEIVSSGWKNWPIRVSKGSCSFRANFSGWNVSPSRFEIAQFSRTPSSLLDFGYILEWIEEWTSFVVEEFFTVFDQVSIIKDYLSLPFVITNANIYIQE